MSKPIPDWVCVLPATSQKCPTSGAQNVAKGSVSIVSNITVLPNQPHTT